MIRLHARAPLAQQQLNVEMLMEAGHPLSSVEDTIEELVLGRDEKAALWLLAWSMQDPQLQRRSAARTLRALAQNVN